MKIIHASLCALLVAGCPTSEPTNDQSESDPWTDTDRPPLTGVSAQIAFEIEVDQIFDLTALSGDQPLFLP